MVLAGVLTGGPAVAAPAPGLQVVTAYAAGPGRAAAVLVDVPAGSRPEPFSVTAAGRPVQARSAPVFSGASAIGVVLDAAAQGESALADGLSGATSLLLQAPPGARAAVVADSRPPRAVTPSVASAPDAAARLGTVRAGGQRDTGQAIALVLRTLAASSGPRVVVLYTGSAGVAGVSAAELAARVRSAGAVLAVVHMRPGAGYWPDASEPTGGVAVATTAHGAIGAFDRVAGAMSKRYLVTFTAPARLPAPVTVQSGTGGAATRAEVTLRTAAAPAVPRGPGGGVGHGVMWMGVAGLLAAITIAIGGLAMLAAGRRREYADVDSWPLDLLPWHREAGQDGDSPGQPEWPGSRPAAPAPRRPERVSPEPRPEPRSEPVHSESVRPEPVRSEPVRPEPVRAETARPRPADPEPARPEPLAKRPARAAGHPPRRGAAYQPTAPFEAIADAAAALVEAQRRARAAGTAARTAAEAAARAADTGSAGDASAGRAPDTPSR